MSKGVFAHQPFGSCLTFSFLCNVLFALQHQQADRSYFPHLAQQYVTAIDASISAYAAGQITVDGAIAQHSNKIWTAAAAAVAIVAGGAFAL